MNKKRLKLVEIIDLLQGEIVCGNEFMHREVVHGFASDLLSDVLTMNSSDVLWLTGLSNLQTVRTAEMADISQIILVRDKEVTPEMCAIAIENHIVIIKTKMSMFRAVGILFQAGLSPVY